MLIVGTCVEPRDSEFILPLLAAALSSASLPSHTSRLPLSGTANFYGYAQCYLILLRRPIPMASLSSDTLLIYPSSALLAHSRPQSLHTQRPPASTICNPNHHSPPLLLPASDPFEPYRSTKTRSVPALITQ